MSVQDLLVPAAILGDWNLRPGARLVYARLLALALARGGGLVFIPRYDLAGQVALSAGATETALRELQRAGRIVQEISHGGRSRPRGFRVLGAAPRLAGLRAVPSEDGTAARPARPRQLTLFDETCPDPAEDRGRSAERGYYPKSRI